MSEGQKPRNGWHEAHEVLSRFKIRWQYSKKDIYTITIGQNPPPEFYEEMSALGFSIRERPDGRTLKEFKKFLFGFSDDAIIGAYDGETTGIGVEDKFLTGWFDNSDPDDDITPHRKT